MNDPLVIPDSLVGIARYGSSDNRQHPSLRNKKTTTPKAPQRPEKQENEVLDEEESQRQLDEHA